MAERKPLVVTKTPDDIVQSDAEAIISGERQLRRASLADAEDLMHDTAEDIRAFFNIVTRQKLRATSPQFTAMALRTAEGIARRYASAPLDELGDQEASGNYVRIAAREGWIEDLAEGDVGALAPWQVKKAALEVLALLAESMTVPNG